MSDSNSPKESSNWIVPITVASISAIAAIVVGFLQYGQQEKSSESKEFVGRVIDAETGTGIRGAKITLEAEEFPPMDESDSEGFFTFSLKDPNQSFRLRVEADGYEGRDEYIDPSSTTSMKRIKLNPEPRSSSPLSEPGSPVATTIASDFQTYRSPKYPLELQYPQDWESQSITDPFDGTILKLVPPIEQEMGSPNVEIVVRVKDLSEDPPTLQEYTDFTIDTIKARFPDSEIISQRSVTFAHSPAYKVIYTGTEEGEDVKLIQVGTLKQYATYNITYKAPLNEFDNYEEVAELVISSFKVESK
jgi:hypothetical protein